MKNFLLSLSICIFAAFAFAGCSADNDISARILAADEAISAGEYGQAQEILNDILAAGVDSLSEQNLGHLSISLMRLSEHAMPEENIAEATECFRAAQAASSDSLRAFSATLTPDELANFYLVKRIAAGIDNPVDLSAEEFSEEDFAGFDSIAPLHH